jgi:amino acid adenylation domain-containing protein
LEPGKTEEFSKMTTNTDTRKVAYRQAATLVDVLHNRAALHPGRSAYVYLQDGEQEESLLTYGDLDRRARAIAAHLQQAGLAGQRVLLLYPSGLEFIAAFWGCLYGGVVPIPSYPPLHRTLPKLRAIIRDAAPLAALSTQAIRSKCFPLFDLSPEFRSLNWIVTDDLADALADEWRKPELDETRMALLQYTSGSTAMPKGVMVSHRSLLHNQSLIQQGFNQNAQSVIVGWLPLYHDMGLIGNVIQPIYLGTRCILMSPVAFMQKPWRWLQAISHYRATTSGGPNFAFDLCVRKITPQQLDALDLSCWDVAFNGAEPIRHETLTRFTDTFAACGFRPRAWAPCYGLAEATLFVSGGIRHSRTIVHSFKTRALEQGRVKVEASDNAKAIISCGRPLSEQLIQIVNPKTLQSCAQDEIGEIWISGASVAQGYWNRPEESRETFAARLKDCEAPRFLRTGDFGFLHQGELFITGRLKDLLVIRGRNHYPQDIEQTVEQCHTGLRINSCAAFSVERNGEERLVIIQEVEPRASSLDTESVIAAIRRAVAEQHELQAYVVLLVKAGSISKTTSGKIQRRLCQERFLNEDFEPIASEIIEESSIDLPEMTITPEAILTLPEAERQAAMEEYLQRLVAQTLKLPLSMTDKNAPIFALGLDSLKAVELRNEIDACFNLSVPMKMLLGDSSIAELSSSLLSEWTEQAVTLSESLLLDQQESVEPELTPGQKALWFLHHLHPESAAYHIASAIRIKSEINEEALRQSFQQLALRHSALRTTFHSVSGKPVQRVQQMLEPSFLAVEISGLSDEEVNHRLVTEAHRPFDLERGPLMRILLFRRADDHILLLILHHIIADFWSMGILIEEVGRIYAAQKRGEEVALVPPTLQFVDYALWHNRMLLGREGERLWTYWKKKLVGELPTLTLPADHTRPTIQSVKGASLPFEISRELTDSLKSLSSAHGVTLYVLILTAVKLMVSKLTDQRDILIGSPVSGRRRTGLSEAVGYMVNPVTLRTILDDEMSLADLLNSVRQSVIEALDHQEFPFQLIVERLQIGRNAGVSPIFQVMFTYHQMKADQQALGAAAVNKAGVQRRIGDLLLESMAFDLQIAQFDLSLAMVELDDGLAGCFQYRADLFERATVQRMAGHLRRVLEQLIEGGLERKISDLELLTEEEKEQLREWNETQQSYASGQRTHEMFEEQVRQKGEATAVESETERLSYKELNRRANQLARRLRKMGVRREVRVGILMERGVEMVVSVLGVMKAGGAYVPLDVSYPQERLDFMMEDAGVEVVISKGEEGVKAGGVKAEVLEVDVMREELAKEGGEDLGVEVEEENAAYVIYTSGSTGLPKGVVNTHGGLTNRLLWMQDMYQMTSADTVLQKTPFSFDVSVWEFFWPLLVGARLVLARPEGHKDPAYLVELIQEQQITILHFVPSMLHIFMEEPDLQKCESLRLVICSGEALPLELVQTFSTRILARLDNLYGPTEAAIDVTYFACKELQRYIDAKSSLQTVPIGKPIANTQMYVLDAGLRLVPVGVAGELFIAGDGLARGYLNRAELTAERFLPNPFSSTPGQRMYRTGDLGRWRADGNLEYLGRLDHQVKLRGFRIELGEIEAALLTHPQISQAVVVAQGEEAHKRLVAYVVSEATLSSQAVREYLQEKLPDYMLPGVVMQLAELPLTSNGKVDRRALPTVEMMASTTTGYVAPRSGVEAALAEIWQQVLGVERVGVHDNFFDLGGHSLLVTQVVARIRDRFNVQLPVMNFFQEPTIEGMALAILQKQAEIAHSDNLAELLDVLENLSQDEVLTLLEKSSQA